MKLKYLFSTILASALMLVGCVQESVDSFDNIKLSQTYLSIPEEGGSVELTVNASEAWAFVTTEDWPSEDSWLTADVLSGEAGETVVTFSAEKTDTGRELELEIKAGNNSQFVRVRQGKMTAVEATCADVIAGPDGKSFIVQGVCTSIASDYYGNWYMNDGTGEIYIYGTKNADGEYDWPSFNIEVGDSVKVEGPKKTYNGTIELVDVSVVKVIKSLIKLPVETYMAETGGDTFDVKLAYKGKGVFYTIPEEYASWVSVTNMEFKTGTPSKLEPNPADTAIVTINVLPNEGKTREGLVVFSSSNGESTSIGNYKFAQAGIATIAEVLQAKKGDLVSAAGQVVAKHGNGFIVADNTAAIYVYGSSLPLAVGNNVTLAGEFDNYYGTLQIKNVSVKANDNATEAPVHPTPMNLQYQADYDALGVFDADHPVSFQHVKIRGVLSVESTGVYVTVGNSTVKTCLYKTNADYSALVGKTVVVTAYVMGYQSKYTYYQVIETSVAEATDVLPALTCTKIKDITVGDSEYTVEGVVVAAGSKAYFIADETGNLLVYKSNHGFKAMDKVRVVGKASRYSGYNTNTMQLTPTSADLLSSNNTWTYNPTVLDGPALDAKVGKDAFAIEVSVTGTLSVSQYANLKVEGASKQASLYYVNVADYSEFNGKNVVIKGYVTGTYNYLNILPYSVEEVK